MRNNLSVYFETCPASQSKAAPRTLGIVIPVEVHEAISTGTQF